MTEVPDPVGDKCADDDANDDIDPRFRSASKVPASRPAKDRTAEDDDLLPNIRLLPDFRFPGQISLLSKSKDRQPNVSYRCTTCCP